MAETSIIGQAALRRPQPKSAPAGHITGLTGRLLARLYEREAAV